MLGKLEFLQLNTGRQQAGTTAGPERQADQQRKCGRSTDVTYVEINNPGLPVPRIYLPDIFYL